MGLCRRCHKPITLEQEKQKQKCAKLNPYYSDGFPLLEHLADDEFARWDDYITHMARDGTYGDQITLYAAANL
ncbi:unnamed protein product [Pocillopora meandrina]|uniref:Uncharacterized protein n=1 Tax=Pocillopora meandrina TaxID=46732 RepID=A0AAU9WB90_9CNID|nr:unnamed protein product [Pocillopora meandrina]